MLYQNTYIKNSLIACSLFLLVACGEKEAELKYPPETEIDQTASSGKIIDTEAEMAKIAELKKTRQVSTTTEEISWDRLIPDDYDPNKIINPYIEQLEKLRDGDLQAMEIYGKIQAELDNAPVNMSMNGKNIKMPGFIAPLENQNGIIDEFLLVPYFGACIHSPPPPMNQTVMVKADKGTGVKSEDSSYPVWITGKLVAVEERTTIGAAGYRIENPVIEPYEEEY